MHIAIAGNIGSGKTTLTKMLAKRYNWSPRFEPVEHNPYLDDFYKDMSRWSFNLQIYFLNKRFKEVVEISQGYMSDRDFNNYSDLFDTMMTLVKLPDLMIYIRSTVSNLVNQIGKRGRECEQTIRIDYLTGLNERYEEWIKDYKGRLIIVDGDTQKFESDPEAFRKITDKIDSALYGMFK